MDIEYIKNLYKSSGTARKLLSNFTYLSILKCLGLLFPLITYPIVIRVVGPEKYGLVVYSQALVSYLIIIINFGFDISATRKTSENRACIEIINKVYSSVVYLKLLLFLFASSLSALIIYYTHFSNPLLLFFFIGLCLQEIFFPIWLYQGLEEMKFITIISFTSQCLYVILLVLFVHSTEDYYWIPIFQSVGGILTSVISIFLLRYKFGIRLVLVPASQLVSDFFESLPFFASRFSAIVMEKTNVIVIGNFFSYNMVAIYDFCTKIVSMLQMPFSLIAQVLYPNVARSKDMSLVKKIVKPTIVTGVMISLVIIIFSKYIVLLLAGDNLLPSIPILCIMVWYAPIVGVSYLFGASTLVVCGFSKKYNLSVLYSVFIYLSIITVLVIFNCVNLYTMAFSYVLPELFVAIYRTHVTHKYHLLNNKSV